jgi:DNA-binding PadR family transcriptional regulator
MSDLQQLRKGSTPLLVLTLLAEREMYGLEIMRELEQRSQGFFSMSAALLYPALHQMEKEGWVKGRWVKPASQRRRKYYTLTARGRSALAQSAAEWRTFVQQLFSTLRASQKSGGARS